MSGKSPLCKQLEGDDKYYPLVAKSSNFPLPAPCPFPKVWFFFNGNENKNY